MARLSPHHYSPEKQHCRGRTILLRRQNITAGCLDFANSHFAVPNSGVACQLWQNFNNLLSILPPRQNNPVACRSPQCITILDCWEVDIDPVTLKSDQIDTYGCRCDPHLTTVFLGYRLVSMPSIHNLSAHPMVRAWLSKWNLHQNLHCLDENLDLVRNPSYIWFAQYSLARNVCKICYQQNTYITPLAQGPAPNITFKLE